MGDYSFHDFCYEKDDEDDQHGEISQIMKIISRKIDLKIMQGRLAPQYKIKKAYD